MFLDHRWQRNRVCIHKGGYFSADFYQGLPTFHSCPSVIITVFTAHLHGNVLDLLPDAPGRKVLNCQIRHGVKCALCSIGQGIQARRPSCAHLKVWESCLLTTYDRYLKVPASQRVSHSCFGVWFLSIFCLLVVPVALLLTHELKNLELVLVPWRVETMAELSHSNYKPWFPCTTNTNHFQWL